MSRPHKSKAIQTIELRLSHPEWSLQEIADQLKIKRWSVWETLKRYKQETIHTYRPPVIKTHPCVYCLKPMIGTKTLCSEECRRLKFRVRLRCAYCQKRVLVLRYLFKYKFFRLRRKRVFCSRGHVNLYLTEKRKESILFLYNKY